MLDYEILRIIWWVLVVVLLIGFSVTDGFDMGVTALLPVAGKKEVERRIMINSIAPHWDGNQVWLLTAGGAILLGETIEKGLMTIPVFAFQIPLLGSLASLLGMFFGALISGLIGALALNLIDKMIAKKQRSINQSQQINKKNDIINSQEQILVVTAAQAANDKKDTAQNVMNRHQEANDIIEKSTSSVDENLNAVNDNEKKSEEIQTRNTSALDEIDDMLNNL